MPFRESEEKALGIFFEIGIKKRVELIDKSVQIKIGTLIKVYFTRYFFILRLYFFSNVGNLSTIFP